MFSAIAFLQEQRVLAEKWTSPRPARERLLYVGIDDTDMPGAPGTNKLARAIVAELAGQYACRVVVRHQLLDDPRVPCTSKNSAAALLFEPKNGSAMGPLADRLRGLLRERSAPGSDPGLCVAERVPASVAAFGVRCQRALVAQREARRLGDRCGLLLEGLGGSEDGVIGALAAVGLAAGGNDGRVVQIGGWPDDLAGPQDIETLAQRGVEVRCHETGGPVESGTVDVGKHLRPNYRGHRVVLFVRPAAERGAAAQWQAVRLL